MPYQIDITPAAKRQIRKLPKSIQPLIAGAIEDWRSNPDRMESSSWKVAKTNTVSESTPTASSTRSAIGSSRFWLSKSDIAAMFMNSHQKTRLLVYLSFALIIAATLTVIITTLIER
jgi:hypothetical protein